jgi:hypothetical protein
MKQIAARRKTVLPREPRKLLTDSMGPHRSEPTANADANGGI